MNATVTQINDKASNLMASAKAYCNEHPTQVDAVKEAAKFTGIVLGAATVMGVGYAVFARVANATFNAIS